MDKAVGLSKRMQAVADMVSPGSRVCDVGCDHGYVSVYLVQKKTAPYAIAMDIREGPLSRAAEHIRKYGVEEYITLRLSDGLSAYRKGEADTLICAGMGGRLLWSILTGEPDKTADFKELILQPQSEVPLFRKFLREKGYFFLEEDMILEEGKFYPIMKVKPPCPGGQGAESVQGEEAELSDLLGPLLLPRRHPVLFLFIEREIRLKEEILTGLGRQEANARNRDRKEELQRELYLLRKAKRQWKEGLHGSNCD